MVSLRARSASAIRSTACFRLRLFAAMPHSPSSTSATAIEGANAPPATAPEALWIDPWMSGMSTRSPIVTPTIKSIVHKTVRTIRRPTRACVLSGAAMGSIPLRTRLGLNKGLVAAPELWHRFKRAPRRSPRVAEGWKRLWAFIRRLPWYRFAAGVLAGGAGLLATFFMRAFGLGVFLPEIAVDFVVGRIPGGIESFFIRSLGEGAKLLALLTALAVFLVLPGVYATLFRRVQRWLKNRWLVMAFYTFTSAGILLLAILPLLDAGFLGSNTYVGAGFSTLSQLLGAWIYAALLDHILVDVAQEYPEGFSLSRRQFIIGSIGAVAVAAL